MAINSKDSLKVHVAAFGKHPGWDDHIEEIGLDSALLVNAKRVIYTECLGGNIDSGVWEKLDNDKLLPFKHTFYWRTGEGLLIGRMWASRDGKGRTKYPMIVCAQIEGVPAGWAIQQVLPRLAAAEEKCSQTNSAELVRLAIGETRRSLEDATAALVGADPKEESGTSLVARLVNEPGNTTPAGREGMVRILYEMEREFGEYKPATLTSRTRTRMGDPAAQHIRVPKSLGGPGEAARAWMALLDQEIALAAPVLVLEPEGQQYIDIIVGEPKAGQFRCVRSGEQALGLTSDVPYTMDEAATKASAEAKLAAWSKGLAKAPRCAGHRERVVIGGQGRESPQDHPRGRRTAPGGHHHRLRDERRQQEQGWLADARPIRRQVLNHAQAGHQTRCKHRRFQGRAFHRQGAVPQGERFGSACGMDV